MGGPVIPGPTRYRSLRVGITLWPHASTLDRRVATEIENLDIRILPAPGEMVIDGKDIIDLDLPKEDHARLKDAKSRGAKQVLPANAMGPGWYAFGSCFKAISDTKNDQGRAIGHAETSYERYGVEFSFAR